VLRLAPGLPILAAVVPPDRPKWSVPGAARRACVLWADNLIKHWPSLASSCCRCRRLGYPGQTVGDKLLLPVVTWGYAIMQQWIGAAW